MIIGNKILDDIFEIVFNNRLRGPATYWTLVSMNHSFEKNQSDDFDDNNRIDYKIPVKRTYKILSIYENRIERYIK